MKAICYLRSVNVAGHNIINMKALKDVLEQNNFSAVKTYLQTGNIILNSSETSTRATQATIEKLIYETFGCSITCFVVLPEDLLKFYNANPYANEAGNLNYFNFLSMEVASEELKLFVPYNHQHEELFLMENVLFSFLPKGMGTTKITNTKIEKLLKLKATGRNRNTITKLLQTLEIL